MLGLWKIISTISHQIIEALLLPRQFCFPRVEWWEITRGSACVCCKDNYDQKAKSSKRLDTSPDLQLSPICTDVFFIFVNLPKSLSC